MTTSRHVDKDQRSSNGSICLFPTLKMSRGGSAGGGKSSLGYLFGDSEPPKPAAAPAAKAPPAEKPVSIPAEKPASIPADVAKQIPAGIQGSQANNYFRADGQNTGNFITGRPSTKVKSDPGGVSSLDYLFGGK